MKPFNCSRPVLSLTLILTCRVNTLVCIILLRSNNCLSLQCFFYTGFGWPKFAYVANPVPPETRCVTYKLHSQRRSRFRFSILPVLYTQDIRAILELWGRPFCSSLLVSFFRCCYERNSIRAASLSHFISLVHLVLQLFFFIQPCTIAEFT